MSSTLLHSLSGKSKMFWAGIATIDVSIAPILLYSMLGPADGNPIGLGLLRTFGVPVGLVLLAISGYQALKRR
jgi:hypothetical protein